MPPYEPAGLENTGTTTSVSTHNRIWSSPLPERDAAGAYTGAEYVRCTGCDIEVLTDERAHATHRVGCPHR